MKTVPVISKSLIFINVGKCTPFTHFRCSEFSSTAVKRAYFVTHTTPIHEVHKALEAFMARGSDQTHSMCVTLI